MFYAESNEKRLMKSIEALQNAKNEHHDLAWKESFSEHMPVSGIHIMKQTMNWKLKEAENTQQADCKILRISAVLNFIFINDSCIWQVK